MAENSAIEWTTHTFNPWRGCTKISAGCTNCYADTLSKRNPGTLGVWGPNGTRVVASEAMWGEPLKWNKAAQDAKDRPRVFCASLADVFEDWPGQMVTTKGLPFWWCYGSLSNSPIPSTGMPDGCRYATIDDIRQRLFDLIAQTPNLDWLILTKRPNVMRDWLKGGATLGSEFGNAHAATWPWPNVWLGTTVEDQQAAKERVPILLDIPAAVHFLSCEPMVGPVDVSNWLYTLKTHNNKPWPYGRVDWVICGGESGHGSRPMNPDWARDLRDQCNRAHVAFHFKQWGEHLPNDHMTDDERVIANAAGKTFTTLNGGLSLGTYRVGKKAAGRLLDGRTWDEFPAGVTR